MRTAIGDSRIELKDALADLFGWTSFRSPSEMLLNNSVGAASSLFRFWLTECDRVCGEICDI